MDIGGFSVFGPAAMRSALSVEGDTTLSLNLTVGSHLFVNGSAALGSELSVGGDTTVHGSLTVSGGGLMVSCKIYCFVQKFECLFFC